VVGRDLANFYMSPVLLALFLQEEAVKVASNHLRNAQNVIHDLLEVYEIAAWFHAA
jgi:hypothetical protein